MFEPRRITAVAPVFIAVLLCSSQAFAEKNYKTPHFGASIVHVGYVRNTPAHNPLPNGPGHYIVDIRANSCNGIAFTFIGGTKVTDDWHISLGAGDDRASVTNGLPGPCGFVVQPPTMDGHYVDFVGGPGEDIIVVETEVDSHIDGGLDNDLINMAWFPGVISSGGAGDDIMLGSRYVTDEIIFADDGNDLICEDPVRDRSKRAYIIEGDVGSDKRQSGFTASLTYSIEGSITSCPAQPL